MHVSIEYEIKKLQKEILEKEEEIGRLMIANIKSICFRCEHYAPLLVRIHTGNGDKVKIEYSNSGYGMCKHRKIGLKQEAFYGSRQVKCPYYQQTEEK